MVELSRRKAISVVLAGVAAPAFGAALSAPADVPVLSLIASVRINVGSPQEQGVIDGKRKRFIPITGGAVLGPRLKGEVLPGGGDWQAIHPDGLTEIFAHYSLKTEDGATIGIKNPGVRVASADVSRRIAAGEDVPANEYYFRSSPVFDVADGAYAWLRRRVFVGRGIRKPDHVLLDIYDVS
jgi:Protein of unknown function (DUF3237)